MAVQSVSGLLKVLEKSALLSSEEFDSVKQEALDSENFDTPEKLARHWVQTNLLTKWQVLQLLSGKAAFFLGKYKLLNLLGVGGMGRVFLAEHTIMHRKVALKVISREFSRNPDAVKQFQAEARAIASLNHINIVQAYNFESEGDRLYIVMEYVDGQSLEKRVQKEGPLPFNEAISYFRQAIKALCHAHQRNMIHCDIKPDNLLLNKSGQIKILDMGIAKLNDSKKKNLSPIEETTESHAQKDDSHILGTVDYLAPEMASGEVEANPRVDIYSLGCTMFFLLTGQVPYPETTLIERILAHQEKPPRDPRELRPDTPKELARIILKMEQKKPEDRYASMDEVLADLNAAFPESDDLNNVDATDNPSDLNLSPSEISGSKKNASWATTISVGGTNSEEVASKRTDSFDFGLSLSNTESNTLPHGSENKTSHESQSGKLHHSKNGKTNISKKKNEKLGGVNLSGLSTKTMIIIGSVVGSLILIIALILVFTSGSSNSKSDVKSSVQSEEDRAKRAAEILKKQKEEAGVATDNNTTEQNVSSDENLMDDFNNAASQWGPPPDESTPQPPQETTPPTE